MFGNGVTTGIIATIIHPVHPAIPMVQIAVVLVFCGVVAGPSMTTTVEWLFAITSIPLAATTTTDFVSRGLHKMYPFALLLF